MALVWTLVAIVGGLALLIALLIWKFWVQPPGCGRPASHLLGIASGL
jgi:hypothetical protein